MSVLVSGKFHEFLGVYAALRRRVVLHGHTDDLEKRLAETSHWPGRRLHGDEMPSYAPILRGFFNP